MVTVLLDLRAGRCHTWPTGAFSRWSLARISHHGDGNRHAGQTLPPALIVVTVASPLAG